MVRATNKTVVGFYEHLGYVDADVVVLGRRLDGQAAAEDPVECHVGHESRL